MSLVGQLSGSKVKSITQNSHVVSGTEAARAADAVLIPHILHNLLLLKGAKPSSLSHLCGV